MTNQEQGLAMVVTAVRQLTPPALDFVVLVFRREGDICMSSAMYPSETGQTPMQQFERAKLAAQAFLVEKPIKSFNPQS